jgi:hypothetical protein
VRRGWNCAISNGELRMVPPEGGEELGTGGMSPLFCWGGLVVANVSGVCDGGEF